MQEGILPKYRLCPRPTCQNENERLQRMRLWRNGGSEEKKRPDGCTWYCDRRISKKNKRKCPKTFSVRSGTFFSGSRLSLPELVIL